MKFNIIIENVDTLKVAFFYVVYCKMYEVKMENE